MDILPSELVSSIVKEVDQSTLLSLWWTSKSFRSLIQLPKTNKYKMLEYPGEDGHIEIFQWLYSSGYKITDEVLFLTGSGGNIELIKFCISEGKLNEHTILPLLDGSAKGGKAEAYEYLRFLSFKDSSFDLVVQGKSIEILDIVLPHVKKDNASYKITLMIHGSDKLISHCIDHRKIEIQEVIVNHFINKIQSSVFAELFRRKIIGKEGILNCIQYSRFDCIDCIDLSSFDKSDTAFMGAIPTFATRNLNCYQIIRKLHVEGFAWHPNAQRALCNFDDLEVVKIALRDVDAPEFYILCVSNIEVLKYCIEKGFEIDFDTTIHQCIEERNIELLKYCTSMKNYTPPKITKRFTTLLQCTPEMFDLLYPTNENLRNTNLNMFFQSSNTELAIHLVKRGVEITKYYSELAIQHGYLDVFRAMYEEHEKNAIDDGRIVGLALLFKSYDILQYAIEKGYWISDDARKEIRTMPEYCHLLGDDIY